MRWLLPEGVEELLPPDGWALEDLRRRTLDLLRERGYALILPPLIEHLEALLSGVGSDLALQTFRLTDQLSGRQLGLRADITPQAARIDARHLAAGGVSRVCYLGTVVRTRPDTAGGSRCLRQLGAEIFGEPGPQADLDIIALLLDLLAVCGVRDVYLDLGHVGIYRALAAMAGLDDEQETALFDLLQRKAGPELDAWLAEAGLPAAAAAGLRHLIDAYGGEEVLTGAREALAGLSPELDRALDELQVVLDGLRARYPELPVHVDLAELRGYRYQTGMVFAAFVPGRGREIARGGRYDGVGADFGNARPATGFSTDLNELMHLGSGQESDRG